MKRVLPEGMQEFLRERDSISYLLQQVKEKLTRRMDMPLLAWQLAEDIDAMQKKMWIDVPEIIEMERKDDETR